MVKNPNWAKNWDWAAMERILRRPLPTLAEMEARMGVGEVRGPLSDPELMTALQKVTDGGMFSRDEMNLVENALYELVERRRQAADAGRAPIEAVKDTHARLDILDSIPVPPESEGNRLELADEPTARVHEVEEGLRVYRKWWVEKAQELWDKLHALEERQERSDRAMSNDSATVHGTLRDILNRLQPIEEQFDAVKRIQKAHMTRLDNLDGTLLSAVRTITKNTDEIWDAVKPLREAARTRQEDVEAEGRRLTFAHEKIDHLDELYQGVKKQVEGNETRFEYDINTDRIVCRGCATVSKIAAQAEAKANDSLDQMNQVRRVLGGDVEPRVQRLEALTDKLTRKA